MPNILTAEQDRALREVLCSEDTPYNVCLFAYLFRDAGLTNEEVSNLQWQDIDVENKRIYGKRPISEGLAEYLKRARLHSVWVAWGTNKQKRYGPAAASRIVLRYFTEKNTSILASIKIPMLRNSYIAELARSLSVEQLSQLLDKDESLLMRYYPEASSANLGVMAEKTREERAAARRERRKVLAQNDAVSKDTVTEEENRAVRAFLKDEGIDEMARLIVYLARYAGLTAAELCELQWADVDLEGLLIKGRLPIPQELAYFLRRIKVNETWVVWSCKNKGPMNRITAARKARLAFAALGNSELEKVTLQRLRTTYISEQARLVSSAQLAAIMGWKMNHAESFYPRREKTHSDVPRFDFDSDALQAALDREGDSVASRVVLLAWRGGYLLPQMKKLRWEDIRDADYARDWERSGEYVLQVDGKVLKTPERQAEMFFRRYELKGYTIPRICGKWQSESDLRRLLDLLEDGGATKAQIADALHASEKEATKVIYKALGQDKIVFFMESGTYHLNGAMSNLDRAREMLNERKVLTTAELSEELHIKNRRSSALLGLLVKEGSAEHRKNDRCYYLKGYTSDASQAAHPIEQQ